MSAVSIDGVWKYYGDYPALLGRNGAGKTTLLRILGGLSKAAREAKPPL